MQESTDAPVLRNVAANLRTFRKRAGLSQAGLAERSGISRRTIINLESGDANIGLAGLDQLAAALDVRFVDLVSLPSQPRTRINELAWRGDATDSRGVLLGSVPATQEVQLWRWALAEGERYDAQPDPEGWSEMLLVLQGQLRIDFSDSSLVLGPGEHASYSSAQQYAYVNCGQGTVQFVRNVVS